MGIFKKKKTAKELVKEATGLLERREKLKDKLKTAQVKAIEDGQDGTGPEFTDRRGAICAIDNTVAELEKQIAELLIVERKAEDESLPELQKRYDKAFDKQLTEAGRLIGDGVRLLQNVRRPWPQRLSTLVLSAYKETIKAQQCEPFSSGFVDSMNAPRGQAHEDWITLRSKIKTIKQRTRVSNDVVMLQRWAENQTEKLIEEAQAC